MSKIQASIDIGSNSILLLVGEFKDGVFERYESESRVTSLGLNLDQTKNFDEQSMADSYDALSEYKEIVKKYNIDPKQIITTATEASRVAQNARDFYSKVSSELGINVQIITSEAEAYYSAKGILFDCDFNEEKVFILDIGGASSEIIEVNTKTKEIINSFSMPFGAVRATNWTQKETVDEEFEKVFSGFSDELANSKTDNLYCVAGTMTSVANISLGTPSFDEVKVHGFKMTSLDVVSIYERLKLLSDEEILKQYPFLAKRSKTIVGGLRVATTIFKWLRVKNIEISTYGLRYGTILEGRVKDEHLA